ncbi:hypothetical protein T07_9599 [Trichinella nelsoni]|uniref:Uncharacterized protein n=1 Tax=Trichinella nelsoni TaxID=6336 RepID=A0A0V0RH61_9BILA|nr:hypothetical protein T07_9599 [Trichinella nelsoni]
MINECYTEHLCPYGKWRQIPERIKDHCSQAQQGPFGFDRSPSFWMAGPETYRSLHCSFIYYACRLRRNAPA